MASSSPDTGRRPHRSKRVKRVLLDQAECDFILGLLRMGVHHAESRLARVRDPETTLQAAQRYKDRVLTMIQKIEEA